MRGLLAAAVLAAALAAAPAAGQAAQPAASPEIEAQVHRLAAELRCPVCQGLSLEDSPTELSQQMKDVIRRQLEAGKSPEEVKAYFVARYGEWILLQPKARGFNLLVYLLPLLALLAGGAVVALNVRRWTRPAP
ncbi:MAG TPA: cytochrome c-type biogenesis protein CcmH, partial [Longimicrobiaceae bacterium]|nr:cytochrome c-type biogenesis protein CcmH [Longimicrobiaceae bacterium]